jgi:DNA invertase Pin-like site-specific DNA recombinase
VKIAIYCRCSTQDQTVNLQLDELRAYCGRRQWDISDEFIDSGFSGSKESRPSLDRLMRAAKRRAFDIVLVYRYDRFARSLKHLVNALCEFDSLGIHFVSLHEGVDTSTPNGKLVFGIFASIAEFERQLIIARTKSGMQAAKARGKHIGRPRVTVNAAKIRSLRQNGLSWDAVAAQTGVSRATCQRAAVA